LTFIYATIFLTYWIWKTILSCNTIHLYLESVLNVRLYHTIVFIVFFSFKDTCGCTDNVSNILRNIFSTWRHILYLHMTCLWFLSSVTDWFSDLKLFLYNKEGWSYWTKGVFLINRLFSVVWGSISGKIWKVIIGHNDIVLS